MADQIKMDEADRAEQYEQYVRDNGIESILSVKPHPQLVVNGDIVCVDCLDIIQETRLQSVPTAARCVWCQEEYEHKHKILRSK